jgi:hypothetical protein
MTGLFTLHCGDAFAAAAGSQLRVLKCNRRGNPIPSTRELRLGRDPVTRIPAICAQFWPHSGHKDVLIVV